MSDVVHARISPSGAERWIACPPSIRMGDKYPDRESDAARQGTITHKIGELKLKAHMGLISPVQYLEGLNQERKDILFIPACEKYAEMYADMVLEKFYEAKKLDPGAVLIVEQKIDLSNVIPGGFGFTDATIIAAGIMEQIDLKFGIGVHVSAAENAQQMLYAHGNLDAWDYLYDIKEVRITIYQPRVNEEPDTWITSPAYIRDWCKSVATPAALMAKKGDGVFTPGDHCRFCKARPTCRALAEDNLRIAKGDFKAAEELTEAEISDILLKESQFTGWVKAVKAYALETARNGRKWPGFKLVTGASKRQYADPDAVIQTLTDDAYYAIDQISKRQPLGITEMTEFLGKRIFDKYVAPLTIKPDGAPTLAPLDDSRPEIGSTDSAIKDFS